jgi:hypothetical protein
MKAKVKFARASTWIGVHPFRVKLTAGEPWYADHPLVVDNPDSFSDEPINPKPHGWSAPVEQATAAPGETRTTRRAR